MSIRRKTRVMLMVLALTVIDLPSFHRLGWAQVDGATQPIPVHIVTVTNPDARLRREEWSAFSSLSLGANVQLGDLIDPGSAPVHILCADLTEQVVSQLDAIPCPQERPVFVQGEQATAGWQRGPLEDIMTPFLVSPRATLVSTAQPIIQWNPVVDANGYRVVVRGEDLNWSMDVNDPDSHELIYPDDAPPLVPGISYSVEIIVVTPAGDGRSSVEEDASATSFVVLAPAQLETIQTTITEVHTKIDNESVAAFVDARYYAQNGLLADAMDALLPLAGDFMTLECFADSPESRSPIVYLMLGKLYLDTQLERYAAIAYSCAVELATESNDLESQALGVIALARLTLDEEKRMKYVAAALELWETLGADAQILALQEEFVLDE